MHRTSSIFVLALLAMASISGMATAEKSAGAEKSTSYVVHVTKNDFAAALFSLENAIVNRGLVIDHEIQHLLHPQRLAGELGSQAGG